MFDGTFAACSGGKGKPTVAKPRKIEEVSDEQVIIWKNQYGEVIKASGAKSSTIGMDKLRKAQNPGQFCRMFAANENTVDFHVKLLSLQDFFNERVTEAPPLTAHAEAEKDDVEWKVSEADAKAYMDFCITLVEQEVRHLVDAGELNDEVAERLAYDSIREFATHFTGKLIHSSANDAFCYTSERRSRLPHVSSRTLIAAGLPLSLDYKKLDNNGVFQRVLRVIQGDPLADDLPGNLKESIKKGAECALLEPLFTDKVDHRLRQILLPKPDDTYLAVSPLAAGGWSERFRQSVLSMESEEKEELSDDGLLDDEPSGEKRQVATKNNFVRRFQRLTFPIGGANPRNTTLFSGAIIQTAYWFDAPGKSTRENMEAWRFLYHTPKLRISETMKAEMVKQISDGMGELRKSAAQLSVKIQSGGALRKWVIEGHERFVSLSQQIQEFTVKDNDKEDRDIDSALLQEKRGGDLDDLDYAILNGAFGSAYRDTMNKKMVSFLFAQLRDKSSGAPFLGEIDRQRIASAIRNILEVC